MSLWSRLFRREAKAWSETERRILADIFGARESITGRAVTWKTALDVTTVFRCVQVLADGVATVPVKLMRVDPATGRRTVASDHPVSWLLSHQPNEWQSSVEFRETLMTHLALTQNAYAFINRLANGRIEELLPIEPQRVRVRALPQGGAAYRVVLADGTEQPVAAENIWHLRARSWDSVMGLEAVRLARESIGLALATEEQHARLHRNGVQTTGMYSVEGTLTKEQYEALRVFMDKQVGGLSNSGKALILDRAAKWTPTGMTGVDSEHLATRRFQIEEVCRAFGVLPIMVGHANEQTTFASAEQMFLAHAVHTVRPWHRRWEASAAKALLTPQEIRAGYYVKFFDGELLRGAAKDRAEYYAKALGSGGSDGWLTPNDVRGFEDLDPYEGGDDLPRRAQPGGAVTPTARRRMTMERDWLDGAAEFKFADADSGARGEFVGYASIFGNVDLGGDVIERGAFAETLRQRKATEVAMLWGHDVRQVPIGRWIEMREDDRGLQVRGQLTLDIPRAREVHAALKEGTVKGLSIGYRIPPGGAEADRNGRVRRIKSVELFEVSVVTFPMNTRAQVARVKGAEMTIREFEAFLRDAGGFSAAAAKAIAASGFKAAQPRDEGAAGDLAALIRRNIQTITSRKD